jgi:kynurenine formamidase
MEAFEKSCGTEICEIIEQLILNFDISGKKYSIDTGKPIYISIPLFFNGEQPNTYDAEKASSKACEIGDFIGDTRGGGSCNFEEIKMIPHCNGTHTECVGHISLERIAINDALKDTFIPALLITINPENSNQTDETYDPALNPEDMLITAKSIREGLSKFNPVFVKALIIRTLPNDDSKRSRRYMENKPPFFSIEAMKYITELNVENLLVDIPSVDRSFDEGKLTAHHIFWDVKQGGHDVDVNNHSLKTITEMIYVPNEIADSEYMLSLQIAPFMTDASPSRALLFRIKN